MAQIDNYFVNIATWLSPGRGYFLLGAVLTSMRTAESAELMPLFRRPRSAEDLLRAGEFIYGGLRRFLPPCAVINIVLGEYYAIQPIFQLPDPPDPWKQHVREADSVLHAVDPTGWVIAALGGMAAEVYATLQREKLGLDQAQDHASTRPAQWLACLRHTQCAPGPRNTEGRRADAGPLGCGNALSSTRDSVLLSNDAVGQSHKPCRFVRIGVTRASQHSSTLARRAGPVARSGEPPEQRPA